MENINYENWGREELLWEVIRLQKELAQVKKLKRLTDDRFLGKGFYQAKTKEERKEIQLMYKPTYDEIYQRLGEYEKMFDGN